MSKAVNSNSPVVPAKSSNADPAENRVDDLGDNASLTSSGFYVDHNSLVGGTQHTAVPKPAKK